MEMLYDRFLHSTYSNPKTKNEKIAILKCEIIAYVEHGTGTKVFIREAEDAIEITMSYDEVKKYLTTADICVN